MSDRRQWVDYPVSTERRQAAWHAVRRRLVQRSPGRLVLALAAAAVLVVVGWTASRPLLHAGQSLSTGATELDLTLADGSRVELAPGSSLLVDAETDRLVSLKLTQGAVLFDVVKRPEREFRVEVESVSVIVVGTRFKVARSAGGTVSVSVERGAVDVLRLGERRRLHVGETWTLSPPSAESEPAPLPPPAPDLPPAPGKQEPPRSTKSVAGPARTEPPKPAAPPEPTADELYTELVGHRRGARWTDAAASARRFLGAFPTESRAALVAFELGRIEMDRLQAPEAALVHLRQAVDLAPGAPFVEDALAREVRALGALGDARCLERRRAFLARFPAGIHRLSVEAACER